MKNISGTPCGDFRPTSFLINLFVLPITMAGLIYSGGDPHQADYYILTLPLAFGQKALAILVFCRRPFGCSRHGYGLLRRHCDNDAQPYFYAPDPEAQTADSELFRDSYQSEKISVFWPSSCSATSTSGSSAALTLLANIGLISFVAARTVCSGHHCRRLLEKSFTQSGSFRPLRRLYHLVYHPAHSRLLFIQAGSLRTSSAMGYSVSNCLNLLNFSVFAVSISIPTACSGV